jgi:aminocarboxymuconate-semialdehyde decarboxylase
MKDKEVFWIDADRSFMRQKNWSRPITDKSFFLDEKLEWMARHSIDHAVVLNLSQLYCNGKEQNLCRDVIRFQNDFNASLEKNHASKFTAGFVVQPLHMDDALKEMQRCVEEYKLKVLCLPTHFKNKEGRWLTVADEWCFPIFELANEYRLAIEIHPYDAEEIVNLEDRFWRFHLVWMCAMTADCYHFFTSLDFPSRFPNVRTCFAHGNQFGQINVGRRKQGFEGRPDLFVDAVHPNKHVGSGNVYFDTLVHDTIAFNALIERSGVSQIVAGLDDPYPLGEMDGFSDSYPGRVIDEAVKIGMITEIEKSKIWESNVISWINGKVSI